MRFNGKKLTVSVWGQSHADAIGAVMDGFPAGFRVDREALAAFMARRAPGQGAFTTARSEKDRVEFLSGLVDGVTCGAPLCLQIRNGDVRSADYEQMRDIPRPSHADWPAYVKYGEAHDVRGGGMFSARMTAPLCAAGALALQWLRERGVEVFAHIASVGSVRDEAFDPVRVSAGVKERIAAHALPVLRDGADEEMLAAIEEARKEADSVGGTVECCAVGLPAGIGGPLFEGLESDLAAAVFAIPAVKGVEFGSGFAAAGMRGSEHNDPYTIEDGRVRPAANHAGGIAGGITTGMPLLLRAAFKPTPSIGKEQQSVSLSRMEKVSFTVKGRHDPCVVPRAVPVVEAVMALVLMDRLMNEGEGNGWN